MTARTPSRAGGPHVLVVGTNKWGVVAALRERADVRVTVVTEPWYADRYRSEGAHEVVVVPRVDDLTAVLRAVAEVMAVHPVTRVLGPSERSVPTAAFLRSHLDIPGTSYDVAVRFTAKHVMKRRLVEGGVPVAPHVVVRTLAEVPSALETTGLPALLKPSLGTGATGSVVVRPGDDARALAAALWDDGRASPAVVVEAFLDVDREYHLDGVVVDGETRGVAVSHYLQPTMGRRHDEFVGSVPLAADDARRPALIGLHDAAVATLGLTTGVTHLEVLEHSGSLVVGEVACRPGGGAITPFLQHVTGLDLWRVFLDLETTGHTGPLPELGPRRPVAWYGLPLTAGRVRSLTTADELRRIPGVTHADVELAVGDVVPARFHSASQAGWVAMAGDTPEELRRTMAAVRSVWRLDVEPVEEVAA